MLTDPLLHWNVLIRLYLIITSVYLLSAKHIQDMCIYFWVPKAYWKVLLLCMLIDSVVHWHTLSVLFVSVTSVLCWSVINTSIYYNSQSMCTTSICWYITYQTLTPILTLCTLNESQKQDAQIDGSIPMSAPVRLAAVVLSDRASFLWRSQSNASAFSSRLMGSSPNQNFCTSQDEQLNMIFLHTLPMY